MQKQQKGRRTLPGFFITGTDTEIGKTLITGCLTAILREKGWDLGIYKPLQSGHTVDNPEGDAQRLLALADLADDPLDVCLQSFAEPVAPLLAAEMAGVTLTLDDLEQGYQKIAAGHEALLVEGAGGIAVPYVSDGLVVDFANRLKLPVIIVARPNLGTVNHTLLTISYARSFGLTVAGMIISGYGRNQPVGDAERMNPVLLQRYTDVPLLGVVPWLGEQFDRQQAISSVRQHVDFDRLENLLRLQLR